MTEQELRALDRRLAVRMGYHLDGEPFPRLLDPEGRRIPGAFGRANGEECWALDCPRFTTDGAAMLVLMEWLTANGCSCSVTGWASPRIDEQEDEAWTAYVWRKRTTREATDYPHHAVKMFEECADTAPLALALAADAALAAKAAGDD